MRSIFTAALIASTLAFAGCAANVDHPQDAEETDEAGNAISKNAPELVAGYSLNSGAPASFASFQHLVLKSDGSYFTDLDVECIRYPCPDQREVGTWHSTDFDKKTTGYLTLKPNGHAARRYEVSLAGDGSGMKLSRSGDIAKFEKLLNFCDDSSDCDGQNVRGLGLMCMKGQSYHHVCSTAAHMCVAKCVSDTPCVVSQCGVACGETSKVCNLFLAKGVADCYASTGKCGRDENGACGWLDQERIDACIEKAR